MLEVRAESWTDIGRGGREGANQMKINKGVGLAVSRSTQSRQTAILETRHLESTSVEDHWLFGCGLGACLVEMRWQNWQHWETGLFLGLSDAVSGEACVCLWHVVQPCWDGASNSVANVWNAYSGKCHNRRDGLATWVANTPGFGMGNHSKWF